MSISIDDLFDSVKKLDKNVVSQLVNAIKENNLEGFDYLEFKHALNKLIEMGVEKETAIKSAFVTASTMGLTEDRLFGSAEHYQAVLTGEKEKFAEALKNQITNRVEKRKVQIEQLRSKMDQIKLKIEALEKSNVEMEQLIQSAETEIAESKDKIHSTQAKFQDAFQAVSNEIHEDITTFKKALKK